MEHDRKWVEGKIEEADREFYNRLRRLPSNPEKWNPPAPNPEEAKRYRREAQAWFAARNSYFQAKDSIRRVKEKAKEVIKGTKDFIKYMVTGEY